MIYVFRTGRFVKLSYCLPKNDRETKQNKTYSTTSDSRKYKQ